MSTFRQYQSIVQKYFYFIEKKQLVFIVIFLIVRIGFSKNLYKLLFIISFVTS